MTITTDISPANLFCDIFTVRRYVTVRAATLAIRGITLILSNTAIELERRKSFTKIVICLETSSTPKFSAAFSTLLKSAKVSS